MTVLLDGNRYCTFNELAVITVKLLISMYTMIVMNSVNNNCVTESHYHPSLASVVIPTQDDM